MKNMSCNKCNKNSSLCGCTDNYLTTNPNSLDSTLCPTPVKCDQYINAACVYILDGIYDAGIEPGTSLQEAIQTLTLLITNPDCVNAPGGCNCPGGGGGGTYTVTNGLNEDPLNNFKLGGELIENTVIDGQGVYSLSASALQDFYILSNFTEIISSSDLRLRAVNTSIFGTTNNRLLNINETLGQVTLDGYYASTGVLFTPTPAYGLGVDNQGNVFKIPYNSGDSPFNVTADNGITANSLGNVRLGGPLVTNTQIPGDNFNLSIGDRNSSSPIQELKLYAAQLFLETPNVISNTAGINQVLKIIGPGGQVDFGPAISLTTLGTGGAATFQGGVLNIPNYQSNVSANKGITTNGGFVQLGGTSLGNANSFGENRFIDTALYQLTFSSANVNASSGTVSIVNTAGSTGTRALSLSSSGIEETLNVTKSIGGASPAVSVINNDSNALSYGITVVSKSTPVVVKTTQTSNNTQVQHLDLHNESAGVGSNNIGGYISMNAATNTNAKREIARISYQFIDTQDNVRKGQLQFSTANPSLAVNMTIKETGQLQLNNYTTPTSFTTVAGVSLLGVDAQGNVVNSNATEGLFFNSTTANVELGKPSLAVSSDFTTNRFINTGVFNLNLSGNLAGTSTATLVVNNNSGTANPGGVGIRSVALGANSIGILTRADASASVGLFASGSQFGIQSQSSNGSGIQAETSSVLGFGVNAVTSVAGYALQGLRNSGTINTIERVVNVLKRGVGNVGANGIGASIDYSLSTTVSGSEQISNRLISTFTNATTTNRVSDFYITGWSNNIENELIRARGTGQIVFPRYGQGLFPGTPVNFLGITNTGEIIEVPGTGGNTYTVSNGLNENPLNNFKLGGPLIENTTITNSGFRLTVTGNSVDTSNPGVLRVINTNGANNSIALYAAAIGTGTNATTVLFQSGGANSNAALVSEATGANSISSITARYTGSSSSQVHAALIANSTNASGPSGLIALTANSGTVPAVRAIKDLGTTYNTAQNILSVSTRGNGLVGGGSALYYEHVGATGTTNIVTNRAESVWKNSTPGTYASTYRITGTNSAGSGQNTLVEIDSDVAAGTLFRIINALPTSSAGLAAGSLYTQTAAQIGGSGSTKVICIV